MWALQFAFRWNWCIWIQLYWFIYIDSFILIYIAWFAVYWLWSILIDLCWFIWIYIVRLAMLPIRWCPRWLQLFQAVCCVRNLTPATYADVREWSVDYWAGSLALQALQALALRMPCFQKSPVSARLGRADDCCEARTPQDETHFICPLLSGLGGWALLPQIDPVLGQWLWKPIGSCRFI